MQPLESSLEALTNRIAKLESQNRRLKKAGIAALLVVMAVITMGQAKHVELIADHIQASRIDADLIQLGGGKDGSTTLLLPRMILVKTGKNALVSLSAWEKEGGASVVVTDEAGYSARLGKSDLVITKTGRAEKTSAASLVLFGKGQKVLWSAP